VLRKVEPGQDEFISEKYAAEIGAILARWSAALLQSPRELQVIADSLADDFSGGSFEPAHSRLVRSDSLLEIQRDEFPDAGKLDRSAFLHNFASTLNPFSKIVTAEFQITSITPNGTSGSRWQTRVRYELVGSVSGFHREQRVGSWSLTWKMLSPRKFSLLQWHPLEETQARSHAPVYADIALAALGNNASYAEQMLHGSDYWRTVLDGACGIDIYGHNGVSIADIDNDGLDDFYVCQPAGLPNRLYRNRGDGTFEDITVSSGLGILENTACALFADFSNRGMQDVILVRTSGPVLYVNEGAGKFRLKPGAFRFTNSPQGTFTGAAVADYDRDGWLDIYFCLYAYYQGTGQYKYPSPYHDANNGPPNFLMRNNRDGTFRDVTAESGLQQNNTRYSFCCAWSDYNHDGWPDLYVVNDFGRKNLYRNNGNGTFTDVAAETGAEDVGAGMSVSWLDYDNDGAPDLYIANMWTAAGERVSTQENFKPESKQAIRALYQKHAMGNSLLHNRGARFEDATLLSGPGMGRWSWSSDALDFDHDGFADLYITNGMVSGPSRDDLNSFFWRQVVAHSPDEPRASRDYEQGWNAINELIRSDGTWSGYERNVFYVNNHDGTFSDVSGALGLDFLEDGRSFALADFDGDGRVEIFLKNRNAPQLRLLKNVAGKLPPSISFRLQGTKSNRDAIGAVITVETGTGRQTRMVQAGSGFLSQHSKEIFFGLGDAKLPVAATIQWPSGAVQSLKNLPLNHRIWVQEGVDPSRIEAFRSSERRFPAQAEAVPESDSLPATSETWLLQPMQAPDFPLAEQAQPPLALARLRNKPLVMTLSAAQSQTWPSDLQALTRIATRNSGLQVLAMDIGEGAGYPATTFTLDRKPGFPPILRPSQDVASIYNILYRQMFDRHRDLTLPTSFLINAQGEIVKVYQGAIDPDQVEKDSAEIPADDAARLARSLPFPIPGHSLEFGRNYLSLGALFFQRGYLDQAEAAFQQASHDDPGSAEALYGIGSVYLNQNKNAAAREVFERAVKLQPSYPDTIPDSWNNLGVLATREGRIDDAIASFQKALQVNPHHVAALDNIGNAYRMQKRWEDAQKVLLQAVELAPHDPEANYSLGMVYAQTDQPDKAESHLQQALKERPDYPEALNNLGILYLLTRRRDQAVQSFERCIRVAPGFDQAYLNLARVYALEGARDQARNLLLQLLKQHPDHVQARQMMEQLQD